MEYIKENTNFLQAFTEITIKVQIKKITYTDKHQNHRQTIVRTFFCLRKRKKNFYSRKSK